MQFLYTLLVGSFPFNAFLAGFFCSLSAFVLTGVQGQRQRRPSLCRAGQLIVWTVWHVQHGAGPALQALPDVLSPCPALPPVAVSLRMQVASENGEGKAPERAFAEYSLAMCVMFLAVWNYIG